jgi:hypothetical protein
MEETEGLPKKEQAIFHFPAQYANYIQVGSNAEEVIFLFGQTSTDDDEDVIPIAKIVISRGAAVRMLPYLDDIAKGDKK